MSRIATGRSVIAGLVVALAGAAGTAPEAAWPQAAQTQEYQLKAVFLFRFAQFADWPQEVFAQPGDPLVIGILGKDPFGSFLDETVKGERANDHPIVVKRFSRPEDVTDCQVLFVSDQGKLDRLLPSLAARHILTVGDVEGFAKKGGIVGFVNDGGRIRLRINLGVAQAAGLKLSSNLLRPAEIVSTGNE